tara:strand:+ start:6844 stop:7998 length:1155 start_codon:yes stop_codon:yes gene_type:complete
MSEVGNLYSSLFGRDADAGGLAHWESSGLTGSALENAILGGAVGSDRTAVLSNSYDDMFSRDYGETDNFWSGDDAWSSHANSGMDNLTRSISGSSIGSDEFSLLGNLGKDQGQTWSQPLYDPDSANTLWDSLMDADGINPDMLKTTLPESTGYGDVTGGTSSANTANDYLNPYLGEVLDNSIDRINEQGDRTRNALGTQAFSAGAYGDARHGVEGAALSKDISENIGNLSAQMHAQGYESAMGYLNTDLDRQANIAFQNAGLQSNWIDQNANLAASGNQFGLNDISATSNWLDTLSGVDQYDRNWTQNGLNSDYEDFWNRSNWDQQQVTGLLNTINAIPGQTGSYSSSSGSVPDNSAFAGIGSFLQSALGGGSSIVAPSGSGLY